MGSGRPLNWNPYQGRIAIGGFRVFDRVLGLAVVRLYKEIKAVAVFGIFKDLNLEIYQNFSR